MSVWRTTFSPFHSHLPRCTPFSDACVWLSASNFVISQNKLSWASRLARIIDFFFQNYFIPECQSQNGFVYNLLKLLEVSVWMQCQEWFEWLSDVIRMLLAVVLGRSRAERQRAHTEALCHLLLLREGPETWLGAQWRFVWYCYYNVRLDLYIAEQIIKEFACFSSRSQTDQRQKWWISIWTSQCHLWGACPEHPTPLPQTLR